MKKIPFKAVAVDMDGTFVNSQNTYDRQRFRRVLDKLHEHDIHFIVASGRPLIRLEKDFAGFMDKIDAISDNGAILVRDKKIINTHYFTHQTTLKLLRYILRKYPNSSVIACGLSNSYVLANSSVNFKKFMNYYYYNYLTINSIDEIPVNDPIDKITLWTDATPEEIESEFNTDYTEQVHATSSGFNCIDIINHGVNKASGIKYFLRYFKINPSELIAFGDGMNDSEMLQLAGYSYAMENADPELKKIAKYEAPSNNENGVLKVLESYLN